MVEHCKDLINRQYKNSSSGGEDYYGLPLDGETGLVISDSDSDAAVNEDTKFKMSVPPIVRAIKQLIEDLNLAFKKVKNMDNVLYNKDREIEFHFDQGKAGFKFAFYEGLGFLEYG